MNKIVKITFIILLIVTFAEIIYYIYTAKYKPKTSISTITPEITQPADIFKAVNPDVITYLKKMEAQPNANNKLYVTFEFNGIIKEVYPDGYQIQTVKFPFGLKFEDDNLYVNSQQKMDKVKFRKVSPDGSTTMASPKDLNEGDKIRIREYFDSSKPVDGFNNMDSLVEIIFEIEKL